MSDDTQMTLFTAEGLFRAAHRGMDRGVCSPPVVLLGAYQRWLATQTGESSIGGRTRKDVTSCHASADESGSCIRLPDRHGLLIEELVVLFWSHPRDTVPAPGEAKRGLENSEKRLAALQA